MMKQGRELKIKIKLIYFLKKKVGSILIEDIYKTLNKLIVQKYLARVP